MSGLTSVGGVTATPRPLVVATRSRAPRLTATIGSFVLVVAIAQSGGGYYPTAWGWCVVAFAWIAGVVLIVEARLTLGRLELGLLGALAGLVAWTALSILWSSNVEQSVLEVQRSLVYLAGALAAVLVLRRGSVEHLLSGLLAGIAWVSTQALAGRLLPGAGGDSPDVVLGRLSEPIGYYNALGLLAVMGALLALGAALHSQHVGGRIAAAAVLPILMTAAYFTFSRGAVLALLVGFAAAVAFEGRRLAFLTSGLLVAMPSAVAVWLAARSSALTHAGSSLPAVAADGRRLVLLLIVLCACSALVALALARLGERAHLSAPRIRRAYVAILGCLVLAGGALVVVDHGGPAAVARSAHHAVTADPVDATSDDLGARLGGVANNGRAAGWRVAWREFSQHPWLGSGAGTFEQFWLRDRTISFQQRDAHSLYLETLAQLGFVGLALVVLMLGMPLAAARRARDRPLVAGAFGAYAAYLVHTGLDWDWEVPIVTLVAFACAAVLIAACAGRDRGAVTLAPRLRALGLVGLVAIALLSVLALSGQRALSAAGRAVDRSEFRAGGVAAEAAVARLPWSAEARHQLGRAQVGLGQTTAGRANLVDAARMNPADWRIWYDLGFASRGRERERAFLRAATLNPLEDDVDVLRARGYRLPDRRPVR